MRRHLKKTVTAFRVAMLAIMAILVVVPVALMNNEHDVVSDIDNRRLTELPEDGTLSPAVLQKYVSDRIGFRKEMIGAFSVLNEGLFGLMVHPRFEYGQDGQVFFRYTDSTQGPFDEDYVYCFASYVKQVQDYCESRDIAFLYVISPEKKRVYQDEVSRFVNWQSDSSAMLKPVLDDMNVNYIDLGDDLSQARSEGIEVFNQKYDVGHWNSEGMRVGTNAIIARLKEMGLAVDSIDIDDYERVYTEQTSLKNSFYPIEETTFDYARIEDGTEATLLGSLTGGEYRRSLEISETFPGFWCYENPSIDDNSLLMFQGSYFNSYGTMLYNQFNRASLIHDYQNIFNLAYYVDIFNPNIVIFENADYTLFDHYYSYKTLQSIQLPSAFAEYASLPVVDARYKGASLEYDADETVGNFSVLVPDDVVASYIKIRNRILDTVPEEGGFAHWGIETAEIEGIEEVELMCVTSDEKQVLRYQVPIGPKAS